MLEIRAARPSEMDAITRIMCIAFNLQVEPTRALLARDPQADPLLRRVVVDNGHVVACLTLAPRSMWIGQIAVPILGISGVATHPDHRGRGHASRLLESALLHSRKSGFGFAALFTAQPEYYERRGWVTVARDYWTALNRRIPPRTKASLRVREATQKDFTRIQALHSEHVSARSGWCLRNAQRWSAIAAYLEHVSCYFEADGCGYMLWDTNGGADFTEIRVLECVSTSKLAAEALAASVQQTAHTNALHLSRVVPEHLFEGATNRGCSPASSLMVYMTDFERAALPLLSQPLPKCPPITAICTDRQQQFRVDPPHPPSRHVAPDGTLAGTAAAWCEVLFGSISLEEALQNGRMEGTGDISCAMAVLRRHCMAIPPVDHF